MSIWEWCADALSFICIYFRRLLQRSARFKYLGLSQFSRAVASAWRPTANHYALTLEFRWKVQGWCRACRVRPSSVEWVASSTLIGHRNLIMAQQYTIDGNKPHTVKQNALEVVLLRVPSSLFVFLFYVGGQCEGTLLVLRCEWHIEWVVACVGATGQHFLWEMFTFTFFLGSSWRRCSLREPVGVVLQGWWDASHITHEQDSCHKGLFSFLPPFPFCSFC